TRIGRIDVDRQKGTDRQGAPDGGPCSAGVERLAKRALHHTARGDRRRGDDGRTIRLRDGVVDEESVGFAERWNPIACLVARDAHAALNADDQTAVAEVIEQRIAHVGRLVREGRLAYEMP